MVNFGNVHPSDVLDMPVDPNEPTYCLCHQVSYGEMIGCDNTDVSQSTCRDQEMWRSGLGTHRFYSWVSPSQCTQQHS